MPIILWIKNTRKPLPAELKFDGWVTAYEENYIEKILPRLCHECDPKTLIPLTVLNIWVKYRPG